MTLRSYLLFIVFVAGVTGAVLASGIQQWSRVLDERGMDAGAAQVFLQEWEGVTQSVRTVLVLSDLVVGSGVTYLGEDILAENRRLDSLLETMSTRPVFGDSASEFGVMRLHLIEMNRIIKKAMVSSEPSLLLPALDLPAKALVTSLVGIGENATRRGTKARNLLFEGRSDAESLASWGGAAYILGLVLLGLMASRKIGKPMDGLMALAREERKATDIKAEELLTGPVEFQELTRRISALVVDLEKRVLERTEKLESQALVLRAEVLERKSAQESLFETNGHLKETLSELHMALTELNMAQTALIKQERFRALGQMVSGLSHDFNNLLLPIVSYSALMLETNDMPQGEQTEFLQVIQRAALDGAQIIGRMRELYRSGPTDEQGVPILMDSLVSQTLELARPRWMSDRERSIEVVMDLNAPVEVPVLRTEVRQALLNLVLNAADAMPTGGVLTLSTWHDESMVYLSIRDTGTGMSASVVSQCFEPFFSTKEENGTGLGLPMVYKVMQEHQGSIEVESVLGEGTTFVCSLPLEGIQRSNNPEASPGLGEDGRTLKGLFVHGADPEAQDLLEKLRTSEIEWESCDDPMDALRHLEYGEFDVWSCGMELVDLSAVELAVMAREAGVKSAPILLLGEEEKLSEGERTLFQGVISREQDCVSLVKELLGILSSGGEPVRHES